MKNFFTILGGMGTEATESYIHLLNKRTPATNDQDYFNYILVNHSTIPDRTDYIMDSNNPNPLFDLLEDIKQQNILNPDFFTLPCNTAHYFYNQLQEVANAPILNMPNEAVNSIRSVYPNAKRIGLIATRGTIHDKIYNYEVDKTDYTLIEPSAKILNETMELIYKDIKERNWVNSDLFHRILNEMFNDLNCDVVILGCTELSLAQERAPFNNNAIIDAQSILVDHTINLATKYQKNNFNN